MGAACPICVDVVCMSSFADIWHASHRVHAALGAAAAGWHHRAIAGASGSQVQPGQDDLPQVSGRAHSLLH